MWLIYTATSTTSFILIFYIAVSFIRRIYIYKRRVKSIALNFVSLNPVTLNSCQPCWSYTILNALLVKKILLNFFNYKGRTSKLLLSYLLSISLVITKVETLNFIWRDSVKPLGVYNNKDELSSFHCYAFTL